MVDLRLIRVGCVCPVLTYRIIGVLVRGGVWGITRKNLVVCFGARPYTAARFLGLFFIIFTDFALKTIL